VPSASVRFYGPLNDFLPVARRQSTLVCAFDSSPSVKDLVEALGVPHPEIDLLIMDGQSAGFGYRVRDGDRVAMYPPIRAFDPANTVHLRPPPPTGPRFVADVHLGRLAAYLRLAGFDAKYRNDYSDDEIVAISGSEDRVLLTRDVGVPTLIMHGDDDQIVPIGASAMAASTLVKTSTLKSYPGFSHGMCSVNKDVINSDLLAFLES
jgi:pimeloyl-ACP methyl ester carboxylesterase